MHIVKIFASFSDYTTGHTGFGQRAKGPERCPFLAHLCGRKGRQTGLTRSALVGTGHWWLTLYLHVAYCYIRTLRMDFRKYVNVSGFYWSHGHGWLNCSWGLFEKYNIEIPKSCFILNINYLRDRKPCTISEDSSSIPSRVNGEN